MCVYISGLRNGRTPNPGGWVLGTGRTACLGMLHETDLRDGQVQSPRGFDGKRRNYRGEVGPRRCKTGQRQG